MYDYYPEPEQPEPAEPEQPEPEPPERWSSAIRMPLVPVNPQELVLRVTAQLEAYGLVVPIKSPVMIGDLCKGFNQCIKSNKGDDVAQTYVFSPKTGSAKSVTAKMYISMLEEESSIVVVPTVADALVFCEDINSWSGDDSYARCYYSVTDKNPDNELRVDKALLYRYRCIVVTHAMFVKENNNTNEGFFQRFAGQKRDLVIVDERIGLYHRHSIGKDVVDAMVRVFEEIAIDRIAIRGDVDVLRSVAEVFIALQEIATVSHQIAILVDENMRQQLTILESDFTALDTFIDTTTISLSSIINPILNRRSAVEESELRKNLKQEIKAIAYIIRHSFSFHRLGGNTLLMATENILSKFGSSVILDATATINEIYNTTAWYKADVFKHILTQDPRIYNNLTINKAKGYPQGATSIYKELNDTTLRERISSYLRAAEALLIQDDDKLLVIGHKEFIHMLEANNTNDRVVFTNWGNHVGKNLWSDCNKVMVIGWFYLPDTEYYGNFINAVGSLEVASKEMEDDMKNKYKVSQLADDLVQAVMRGSARKTISTDGDCAQSEVFVFYPENDEGHAVMKLFESEFVGATINEWEPRLQSLRKRVLNSTQNLESVMKYLANASTRARDVSQSDIIRGTGLSKAVVSRTLNHPDCVDRFERLGYTKVGGNGRATIIHLS